MWRNYLTVGFRAFTRSRTFAVINILGLALGLAACLLLLLYVRYEIAADRSTPASPDPTPGVRIEMADIKERLRRLEAIATGVDLGHRTCSANRASPTRRPARRSDWR